MNSWNKKDDPEEDTTQNFKLVKILRLVRLFKLLRLVRIQVRTTIIAFM